MTIVEHLLDAQAVTRGKHHFFGYYDKFPYNSDGRYVLALETTFMDRQPAPDDKAVIGMVDTLDDNCWQPLDTTTAWNWQQATMLQWLPTDPDGTIIYNQRQNGHFVATLRNIDSGETRQLSRPVYTLSRDGKWAVSLNFARLHQTRPGYGYAGLPDPYEDRLVPAEDGAYVIDLETGASKLAVSLAEAANLQPKATMHGAKHWFNHAQINTDSTRFALLHRWQGPEDPKWYTRLITANRDGSDIHVVADDDYVSHYDWYSPQQVVAWANYKDQGNHYYRFNDDGGEPGIIGDTILTVDGHCSFSPDRQWMLTDTYPNQDHIRTLILYHMASATRINIGHFYAPPELKGPIRCDLHPCWRRDGRAVCIELGSRGQTTGVRHRRIAGY